MPPSLTPAQLSLRQETGQPMCLQYSVAPPCPDGCSGPAILAPNYICPDGSTGGPICGPIDGICLWHIRTCPDNILACPVEKEFFDDPRDSCTPSNGGADCPKICCDPYKPAGVVDIDQCLAEVPLEICGAISGLPCGDGRTCFDNPYDDCDPATGGADCSGVCCCGQAPICCDRHKEPGKYGNPPSFEGHQCCPVTGEWTFSIGVGKTFPCPSGSLSTGPWGKACPCSDIACPHWRCSPPPAG